MILFIFVIWVLISEYFVDIIYMQDTKNPRLRFYSIVATTFNSIAIGVGNEPISRVVLQG